MAQTIKKRHVISFEKMSPELLAAFNEKYPGGLNDCLDDIQKYPKPDGTSFYAITLEVPDAVYLVKIQIQVDDLEDVERWLDGEEEAETEQVAGTSGSESAGDDTLPDDNISQYGSDDDQADA